MTISPAILWALVAVLAVLVVLLIAALWSSKRLLPTELHRSEPIHRGERFDDMVAFLSLGCLTEGNSVTLLHNGVQFFPALLDAIYGAKSSVHLETYLWKTGEASRRVAGALIDRAKAGVEVRVVMDAIGGKVSKRDLSAFEEAGVELAFYNRRHFSNLGALNQRDHRKLAVIDGRIGFVGGHCIADEWLGDAEHRKHYRDISARIEGPIVAHMQAAFSDNWTEASAKLLFGEHLFPRLEKVGTVRAHLAHVGFGRRISSVRILHHLAIQAARSEILIQNPYFLPDDEATEALCAAVKRGVRVRVMMPTLRSSDNRLVQHASHYGLRPLIEGGVELYLYDRTLLHQKVLVIDREWCAVGSTNFDDRSMTTNEEITLSMFDRDMALELVGSFHEDLKHARRLLMEEWRSRGPVDKAADWAAWQIRAQL